MSGRIKGAAFREYMGWLRARIGDAELVRVVGRMPKEHASIFTLGHPQLGVLSGSWYEGASVHAFLDELSRGRSDDEVARLARDGAVAALEATLTGVHKALLRVVGSPELHARFSQRLWNTYYEEGLVRSVRVAPRRQRIAYGAWRSHHPFLCQLTTSSDLVVFSLMGLQDVRVAQDTCIDRGDPDCAHFVDWS